MVYPYFVIFQRPFSSMELHESPPITIRIRDEWTALPFQMEKGMENCHAQAYAPRGAMGLK